MDHLGAAGKAEDRLDLAAVATGDAFGIARIIGDEAAPDLGPGGIEDRDRVAAMEVAADGPDACRQQALAGAKRPDRTIVDNQGAVGLDVTRYPFLTGPDRIGLGGEPGAALAFGDTSGGFRRLIQIVFGLSIAFAASSFFLSFFSFGGGALV